MKRRLLSGGDLVEPESAAPIRLSSRCTFYWKVSAPLAMASFLVLAVLSFGEVFQKGDEFPALPWLFLAVTILGPFTWWGFLLRLKEAWLEGDSLRVSSLHDTERIPLAQIREVRTWTWLNPKVVKVLLDGDSRFGKSILFALPLQLFPLPWEDHPLAEVLRDEVVKARTNRENTR
jgi:hypothetical protein